MIIFEQNNIRISLITSRLLRVETGAFTDLATQTVINRDFEKTEYKLEQKGDTLSVITNDATFNLTLSAGDVKSAKIGESTVTDFADGRLPGTARTLDTVDGECKLEQGITSTSGVSEMDDSDSLLVMPDGSISPREDSSDVYYFAYGHDYLGQLRDFFKLTGEVPLIPKYALGNWWSRYYAYTQEEYRGLMKKFIDKELPITVATIDMDWHWTDVIERFGKNAVAGKPKNAVEAFYNAALPGWTGYSWNTELFPDYRELLTWLHDNGHHVTLNVHPSQGVRFFEDQYADMCRALGRDPEKKEIIGFDITDPAFRKAYFEVLHHPFENEGVDFWWIDWQQGKKTNIPGLDPLWALNHYHTADSGRAEKRGLILSRYAGLGSHRYPLGFSGDTVVSWKSLDFQPYFTNCAANAGYTWWSHDIGGHMRGIQDDELYLRWLQYGVFSPINRLHSSNSEFMGKEPWKKSYAVEKISEEFLRLRHKMIPYMYSANYRTHTEGEPICMPMYYRYDNEHSYKAKNQYIFGGTLMVCPITRQMDKKLNLAYVDVYLPEGRWTDIFNGRVYEGGRWVKMYRDLDSIPVLAPAGAIIPMYRNDRTNDLSNSQPLEVHIWRGEGHYELYEDDGETNAYKNGEFVITKFDLTERDGSLILTIIPPSDTKGIIPTEREIFIKFRDIIHTEEKIVLKNEPITLEIQNIIPTENESESELRSMVLTRVQGNNDKKSISFKKKLPGYVEDVLSEFEALKR